MLATVECDAATGIETNFMFKTNEFRNKIGEFGRREKMKRICWSDITVKEEDRRKYETPSSSMSFDYRAYCDIELKHFNRLQSKLSKRCLARLELEKYMRTSSYLHKLCKKIVGNGHMLFITCLLSNAIQFTNA